MPSGSSAIARGPFSGVPASGAPSGVGARSPVPAKVSMRPVSRSTRRIRWLPTSQISRRPSGANTMLCGARSRASRAGPPSPENPASPVPATVEMIPVRMSTLRTTWLSRSTT